MEGAGKAGLGFDGAYVNRWPRNTRLAVANPDLGLEMLDQLDAQDSLLHFIEIMWSVLEPGRPFVRGWCIEAICEHLEAVSKGHIRKLLINVPPGCMKSLTTNVFFPAWEWGPRRRPDLRYIGASYSQDLTLRDNRRCRQVISSEKYQSMWGDVFEIAGDQDAKGKFETSARGWKIATSVGGAVVGERADRFIIDDPHNIKVVESDRIRESTLQWFTEVVPTRVNDPDTSVFIVIMQRVHERDVSGLILAHELGYEYLCLPMEFEPDHPHLSRNSIGFVDKRQIDGELLWPERFTARYIEELKAQLRAQGGGYAEAGQLQQRPSPRGGGMFARKWWRYFKPRETSPGEYHAAFRPAGTSTDVAVDQPSTFDWIVLTCDAAFKSTNDGSRVSIMVVGGKGPFRFILDNVTKPMTFKETCEAIVQMRNGKIVGGLLAKYPHCRRVLIEDKANGPAIIDTLRQFIAGIIPVNPEGGKESRASAIQPSVESGHVLLPEGAVWLEDFISEFASFPVGAKDDQVDALSQAMIFMTASADVARAIGMANW